MKGLMKIFTVGSLPPKDNQAASWAQQSFDQPMPVDFVLEPMDLLLARYLNTDNDKRVRNLRTALDNYCYKLKED